MYSLFLLSLICWFSSSRQLYQSQCVFRHGARAPSKWIIPPYYELFQDIYNANPADLTFEGILQHKAFGSYLQTKYLNENAYFFTNQYNNDRKYISISTSNTQRTHQSVQSLISTLYDHNQYAQIYTVPLNEDLLRVSESCLNFNAELNFQEANSANYSKYLFNKTDNDILFPLFSSYPIFQTYPNLTCEDLGASCYLLLFDEYKSISFHLSTLNPNQTLGIDDNGTMDILQKYHISLEELGRFNSYIPYTSEAQNIGFELLNEIVNHLDCSVVNLLSGVPCSNANDQVFEQGCDAGFCGLVLYSGHDSTLRSLAHQMGILTQFNEFNAVPYGASICFDSYREDDNSQTVDILYGYPVKDENEEFGYYYQQEIISDFVFSELSEIINYRNNRIPTNNGCCNIEGHSKQYFDAVGCDNFESTTDEITEMNGGYDTCSGYRQLCPATACGNIDNGLVYAPSVQKCVAMQQVVIFEFNTTEIGIYDNDKRDCDTDEGQWYIIGLLFIILFAISLLIMLYFGYMLYCKPQLKLKGKGDFENVKQTEDVELHETI